MDQSLFHQSRPCWYRYNNLGAKAANDGIIFITAIFYIIRKYFKEENYYVNLQEMVDDVSKRHHVLYKCQFIFPIVINWAILLMKLFLQAIFTSRIGQYLNLSLTNFGKKPNLDLFTMNQYNSITEFKTSQKTFILPVIMAMQLVRLSFLI